MYIYTKQYILYMITNLKKGVSQFAQNYAPVALVIVAFLHVCVFHLRAQKLQFALVEHVVVAEIHFFLALR